MNKLKYPISFMALECCAWFGCYMALWLLYYENCADGVVAWWERLIVGIVTTIIIGFVANRAVQHKEEIKA